jgi:hypothetical protein
MKSKLLLEKYIKVAVKKALKEQEELNQKSEKAVYLIYKFPGLKKVMEDFMSPAFSRYISNISVVSPKPTTLNISLINGQSFQLYYSGQENFVAKIAGRRYNTSEVADVERASKAITNLLLLNYASPEEEEEKGKKKDDDIKKDLASGGGGSHGGVGNFPGDEPAGDSGTGNEAGLTDNDLEDTTTPNPTGGTSGATPPAPVNDEAEPAPTDTDNTLPTTDTEDDETEDIEI